MNQTEFDDFYNKTIKPFKETSVLEVKAQIRKGNCSYKHSAYELYKEFLKSQKLEDDVIADLLKRYLDELNYS